MGYALDDARVCLYRPQCAGLADPDSDPAFDYPCHCPDVSPETGRFRNPLVGGPNATKKRCDRRVRIFGRDRFPLPQSSALNPNEPPIFESHSGGMAAVPAELAPSANPTFAL